MRFTERWLRRSEIYRLFGDDNLDWSEEAKLEAYLWETRGIGNHKFGVVQLDNHQNGYIIGKHWMDVTVKMWREDIKASLLFERELYSIKRYPVWWLDEILYGIKS